MPISLHRLRTGGTSCWAVCHDDSWGVLDGTLAGLLAVPLHQARAVVEAAGGRADADMPGEDGLPPIDRQEVWAAGVTYLRSRDGRKEEAADGALYDHGYDNDRP